MFSIVLLGSCQKDIEGCTDATAVNYNPDATIPNSTCQYVPTLTTIPINTNFPPSYNYFTGGIISSDGGSFVTLRGVCYSSNPEPTIDDDKTIDGDGTGVFNSRILTSLEYNTTYYIRAYATNSNGTGYGNEVTYTTGNPPPLAYGDSLEGGMVFYIDSTGNGGGLVVCPVPLYYDNSPGGGPNSAPEFGCHGIDIPGADSSCVGCGSQNTIDIVNANCPPFISGNEIAANMCADLNFNGFSDWFLPSKDEFQLLWDNCPHCFGPNTIPAWAYWTSTEYDQYYAYSWTVQQFFITNKQNSNGDIGVIAIRAF